METEKKRSKWTDWTVIDNDSMMGASYKTNHKKTRVKIIGYDDIVGESCCCKHDVFDLAFGIRMAYLRCLTKAWEKNKAEIDEEIAVIDANIKKMIDSLYAKE